MFHRSTLTHSLDCLTGDGSLRPPDVATTGHVPSSICSEPDIDLQLADPDLSGTTSRTFPCRSVIRSVTGTGVDNQNEVLYALVLILADDVRDRILRFACRRYFVAESGSLFTRLVQSRTSVSKNPWYEHDICVPRSITGTPIRLMLTVTIDC